MCPFTFGQLTFGRLSQHRIKNSHTFSSESFFVRAATSTLNLRATSNLQVRAVACALNILFSSNDDSRTTVQIVAPLTYDSRGVIYTPFIVMFIVHASFTTIVIWQS